MYKSFLLFVIAVFSVKAFKLDGADRIVGGVYRNDINYVISLQEKQSTPTYERGHKCGGVLITRQNALTAASCVIGANGQPINATNFRVFAGTVLTNDNADSVRDIASITIHPNYTSATSVNDIAVITLQAAFPNSINPISLPAADLPLVAVCETSGFGARNTTSTASAQLLTHAPVSTIPSAQCYTLGPQLSIVSSMVCGLPFVGAGCAGDTGNPLVCNIQNAPVLSGLLSQSNNCSVVTGDPEVYTRVYSFAPWVNEVLTPASTPASTTTPAPGAASTSQLGTAVAFMFVVIQCFKIFN